MIKLTAKDVKDCAKLGTFLLATHWLPQNLWPNFARLLAAGDLALKRRLNRKYLSDLSRYLGPWLEEADLRTVMRRSLAETYLEKLVFMANLNRERWRPDCRVLGAEQLSPALEEGRGAILWSASMVFTGIVSKMAFHEHGYPLYHLSDIGHGVSATELGSRYLNPLIVGIENRYLAERIVLDRNRAPDSFLSLVGHLRKNRLVSIRFGSGARKLLRFPFLGGSILIPIGPIALSRMTGAPLHPLITVKTAEKSFDLHILPPLPTNQMDEKSDVSIVAAREFSRVMERSVLSNPELWRGWHTMKIAEGSGLEILPSAHDEPGRPIPASASHLGKGHDRALGP